MNYGFNTTFNNISVTLQRHVSLVSFGFRSTRRKTPICHKSMTNLSNNLAPSTPHPSRIPTGDMNFSLRSISLLYSSLSWLVGILVHTTALIWCEVLYRHTTYVICIYNVESSGIGTLHGCCLVETGVIYISCECMISNIIKS